MSFAEQLEPITACQGVLAALITDRDGIPVEARGAAADLAEEMAAEFSSLIREVSSANRELQLGAVEQVVVAGVERAVVITAITGEYFLMTLVEQSGNQGQARFRSRLAAHRLRNEFA